jgi:hypothetical protein
LEKFFSKKIIKKKVTKLCSEKKTLWGKWALFLCQFSLIVLVKKKEDWKKIPGTGISNPGIEKKIPAPGISNPSTGRSYRKSL